MKKISIATISFFCALILFACGGLRAPESETQDEDTGGWETDANMTDTGTGEEDTGNGNNNDTGTTPDPDTGTTDTGKTDPRTTDTGTREEDTGNGNNNDTDSDFGEQLSVTVDCGSNECQPHIFHWNPEEQQWDDRFPGGTKLSDFKKKYTFKFGPKEICNVISTYDKQASQSGTVMGFEMGVRDVSAGGPAGWYGEENAPSEENYSVQVNGRSVTTSWSYPSWSEAPLKQVHLRSVCP